AASTTSRSPDKRIRRRAIGPVVAHAAAWTACLRGRGSGRDRRRPRAGAGPRRGALVRRRALAHLEQRKRHPEDRAPALLALHPHPPAVALHDVADDVETQAEAADPRSHRPAPAKEANE